MPHITYVLSSYEALACFLSRDQFCSFRSIEGKKFCVGGAGFFSKAPTRHTASTRGLACEAADQNRVYKSRLGLNLVTGAEVRNFPRRGFQTQISSRRIGEWHDTLSMAALLDLKPQKSAWGFDLVARRGFVDVVVA